MRPILFRPIHVSFIPILCSIGIIAGVTLGFFFDLWIVSSPLWLAVSCCLLIINFCCRFRITFCLALIAGIIIGSFRISSDLGDRVYIVQFIDQTITIEGVIYEDPGVDGATTTLRLNQLVFISSEQSTPVTGNFYCILRHQTHLERSAKVTLTGKLSAGFGSFAGTMYRPHLLHISTPDPPDLALSFRNSFAAQIKRFIPAPAVDLSLGYLLGQRRALPTDLLEALRIVGLTHIIVASGYNLSILVRFSRRLMQRVSRFAALFSGAILIVAFMAITGFSPSMARAGLVAGLSLLAWFFGRKFHPVKLLLLVASITLLINPFYVQDLGWLLSFLSFIGILIVAPLLTAYFYSDKKPNFIVSTLIETTAAQICCLPLIFYFFGTFSILSILANLLILPTIPLTMLLTFLTGITSFFAPLAHLIGWLAKLLLSFHIFITNSLGTIQWALIEITPHHPLALLTYPLILLALLYLHHQTKLRLINSTPP